jgi:AraC-like DNA-binding protein
MSIPLLRVSSLQPFLNFLESVGTPTERILRECKLPIFALNEPNNLLVRHYVFNFLDKAARQENIPDLGLLVGKATPVYSLGLLGRLAYQTFTLYESIAQVIKIAGLFNSGERYCLREQGSCVWFCQEYREIRNIPLEHACGFSLCLMLDLVKTVAGKNWYPQEIALQTPQIPPFFDHPFGQVRINRDIPYTGLAFPRFFLSLPFPAPDLEQKKTDYQLLVDSAPASDWSESLTQAIAPYLRDGYPSIHLAAAITRQSVRSLQRNLAKEGLTYSRLVTRLRQQIALDLLAREDLKIIDIAQELGYEDAAHFSRAFKQWTGLSPRTFRRQHWE